jgi:tetratricopeptide (TPR) repeat protein
LTEYQVDPALEYRTFAHVSAEPIQYLRAAIRHDGSVLAAGTSRGVALCDLARGTELGFLTIGPAVHLLFEASGDLLTSGSTGVQRWPIQLNFDRAEFRIGPPRQLKSFPSTLCGIAEDASGRVVALANRRAAYVMTPERAFRVAPLDDVRSVAVSPDGQWLVTGSHGHTGAEVWQVRDGARVEHLPIEGLVEVIFSPDGKWLMSQTAPCGLWAARTWREARRIGGDGLCFSPDGRLMAVQDARKAIRLVESETGLTLARLESPDLCEVRWATFSPDGSRLVVTTNDGPAVHVWDLRAIRRQLTAMKLDWDAPAYSDDDPCGPAAPPLPPLQVDYGRLAAHREHHTESPATLVDRYAARLKTNPDDADAFHHHAHALIQLSRLSDAREDLTRAIRLRPNDAHFRTMRGGLLVDLKQLEPAIVDLEAALAIDPDLLSVRELLARCYNNQSWELATGPEPRRDLDRALALSRRAVALTPGEAMPLNTLGVVQYRTGRYHEAVATLEQSLAGGRGQSDAFDLFFLAMAHYRLGHRPEARDCFDRAGRWLGEQKSLPERQARELAAFRAEAEAVLAGTVRELPDNVFAMPRG